MAGSICITNTMWYIKDEMERVMTGEKIEGKGVFYHDVPLSLVTCTRSIDYLEKHNLLKYWLLPLEDLHPEKRYIKSIPGDIRELNILDETCDVDIHASDRYHVAVISRLQKDDPHKFSFATPDEISRAYLRITDPITGNAPSHKRRIQDCLKWFETLEVIRKAGGKMVEGFVRNSYRERSMGKEGGCYQVKKPQIMARWLHNDAAGLKKEMMRNSIAKVNNLLHRLKTPSHT
jgi:hypothetical protein